MREEVAANMRRELDQALRNRNKAVVMDRLYRDNPIDLPNALLESQIQ
ncbi:MAG: trigger factor, partial [Steroidobacteraceae bacterium]